MYGFRWPYRFLSQSQRPMARLLLDYCEICEFSQIPQACANCTKFAEWCHHGDLLRGANFQFDRISVVFNRRDIIQTDQIFKLKACKS